LKDAYPVWAGGHWKRTRHSGHLASGLPVLTASRDKAPESTEPVAVTLSATVEHGELRIRAWDPDPTPPPRDQPLPGDDAESGRGLFIVNALSSRWGWHPAPNGGKFVWSALSLDTLPPDD
jgi:hypothetical protein